MRTTNNVKWLLNEKCPRAGVPFRLATSATHRFLARYMKRHNIPGPVPAHIELVKAVNGQVLMHLGRSSTVFFEGSEAVAYVLRTPTGKQPRRGVLSDQTYVL